MKSRVRKGGDTPRNLASTLDTTVCAPHGERFRKEGEQGDVDDVYDSAVNHYFSTSPHRRGNFTWEIPGSPRRNK